MKKSYLNAVVASVLTTATVVASSAHAALDSAKVTEIQTEVLGDVSVAVGAGFAVLAVVLASSIGFSLLGTFIKKGASGG